MFFEQDAGTWTSVLKVEKNVERTLIALTPMVAITVSVKLVFREIHVRFLHNNQTIMPIITPFFLFISSSPDSECKDIDECQHFNGVPGSANFTYWYPTFRNLPGDVWTMSSYAPQPCAPADACINIFYKDGQGFKCVPADQTFAAVAIGGLNWNSEVDILKADLNRCDGMIPKWHNQNTYRHKVRLVFKTKRLEYTSINVNPDTLSPQIGF